VVGYVASYVNGYFLFSDKVVMPSLKISTLDHARTPIFPPIQLRSCTRSLIGHTVDTCCTSRNRGCSARSYYAAASYPSLVVPSSITVECSHLAFEQHGRSYIIYRSMYFPYLNYWQDIVRNCFLRAQLPSSALRFRQYVSRPHPPPERP